MQIKRGDVWYIERGNYTGCEQSSGRPAVVVSNEKNNEFSSTVEVVYLTTQPKRDLPTHVTIRSVGRESIAICEQITTVSTERVGDYKGFVTDEEMAEIERAMLISLGLPTEEPAPVSNQSPPVPSNRLAEAEARCAVLQQMYDSLLDKVIKAGC